LSCVSLIALVALGACSATRSGSSVGSVNLPLQASSPSGNVYQLRNATFTITGPTSVTLSTSGANDPSPLLQAMLATGTYTITLQPGWSLFRVNAAGASQLVTAVLVSPNPSMFTIQNGQVTIVGFAFEVQGDSVDFGQGSGHVVITVTERDGAAGDGGAGDAGTGPFILGVNVVGPGQVSHGPDGLVCGSTLGDELCNITVAAGEVYNLSVLPQFVPQFQGWSGDCVPTGPTTATVTMTSDKICTATFGPPDFILGVNVVGPGQVSHGPDGLVCGSILGDELCNVTVAAGTVYTLSVLPQFVPQFQGWSDDCVPTGATTATVTMTSDKICTATFAAASTRTLTLTTTGSGQVGSPGGSGVSCGSPTGTGATCTSSHATGSSLTLVALPPSGVSFIGWGGDCAAAGASVSVTINMSVNRNCTATFATSFVLTVSPLGPGSVTFAGFTCSAASGGTCSVAFPAGQMVSLIASPLGAASFTAWSGDCAPFGNGPVATVTMTAPRSCSASFMGAN
jgi:hypothetical protein